MTSEVTKELGLEKKCQKRPSRPRLLRLTDVSLPTKNRKKAKIKVKERTSSNNRERIYDDPAYTDDISHLAIPLNRGSDPNKSNNNRKFLFKKKNTSKLRDSSSSSDNMPPDPGKMKRGFSLERSNTLDQSPQNRQSKRDHLAKQKRNLSLDTALLVQQDKSIEDNDKELKIKSKSIQRQNASDLWGSCIIPNTESIQTNEIDTDYYLEKDKSKLELGKRFLKGEIGIKSFNYYLLKEGLKTTKKIVEKQTEPEIKLYRSKSDENIYEEIFYSTNKYKKGSEKYSSYPDCELCLQQCQSDDCEYCLHELNERKYLELNRNLKEHISISTKDKISSGTHVLQFHSYNPNNPEIIKVETTPVTFTSDYNPIYQLNPDYQVDNSLNINTKHINRKSSSSNDSLYPRHSIQDGHERTSYTTLYPRNGSINEPKIYKSDSKASIFSEHSIHSENSNRNYNFCGTGIDEISDSSLGDSLHSYSIQRRYYGSSESCRFASECRRCSIDGGEKCSFSDTCHYECKNCDCSSSYFSSDFDDINYTKNDNRLQTGQQRKYEYYNDTAEVKQNKYAQDFIRHVNDVKRSIYQSEVKGSKGKIYDLYSKQLEHDKSIKTFQTNTKMSNCQITQNCNSQYQNKIKINDINQHQQMKKNNNISECKTFSTHLIKNNSKKETSPNNYTKESISVINQENIRKTGAIPKSTTHLPIKKHNKNNVFDHLSNSRYNYRNISKENEQNFKYSDDINNPSITKILSMAEVTKQNSGLKEISNCKDEKSSNQEVISLNDTKNFQEIYKQQQITSGINDDMKIDSLRKLSKNDKSNFENEICTENINNSPKQKEIFENSNNIPQNTITEDAIWQMEKKLNSINQTSQLSKIQPNQSTIISTEKEKILTTNKISKSGTMVTTNTEKNITSTITKSPQSDVTPDAVTSPHWSGCCRRAFTEKTKVSSAQIKQKSNEEIFNSVDTNSKAQEQSPQTAGNNRRLLSEENKKTRKLNSNDNTLTLWRTKVDSISSSSNIQRVGELDDGTLESVTNIETSSRDSDAISDTSNRNQSEDSALESKSDASKQIQPTTTTTDTEEFPSKCTKIDISELPLPEIPPKKKRSKLSQITLNKTNKNSNTDLQTKEIANKENVKDIKLSDINCKNKEDIKNMHYLNSEHIPSIVTDKRTKKTYLFGESRNQIQNRNPRSDEIYLNKSGWVQVSSRRSKDENEAIIHSQRVHSKKDIRDTKNIQIIKIDKDNSDKIVYAVPRINKSKAQELIARNENRRNNVLPGIYFKPGTKIVDPQIAIILNERPGFLPVKNFDDNESPPPVTPILSPPPAFQDSKTKNKLISNIRVQISSNNSKLDNKISNGAIFSRSFDYDGHKPTDYIETFSRSFDSNLRDPWEQPNESISNFSSLTGSSPNFLAKRESSPKAKNEIRANSYPKRINDHGGRLRRAQFSRAITKPTTRFRSFDTSTNQRLNSCDSGARSDLSNDEVDDVNNDIRNNFLSTSYHQRQRSITPERSDGSSSQNGATRKRRPLTPDRRSLTPEDRLKKGSQISLGSRQSSGSRSNTLERKAKTGDTRNSSRSSSSSSYSGREIDSRMINSHRRTSSKNSKSTDDHRIRRSRSLQLSKESPNHSTTIGHKTVITIGPQRSNSNQQNYHQPIPNFPSTIRPDQIISDQSHNMRQIDIDKSRSFDFDYNIYNNQKISPRLDFDKSRSFDDDYREQNNHQIRQKLKPITQRSQNRQNSPQNHASRLCDHDITYTEFNRDYDKQSSGRLRDNITTAVNELNFLNGRIYDCGIKLCNQSSTDTPYINNKFITHENYSPDSDLSNYHTNSISDITKNDFIYRQPVQQHHRSVLDRSHQQAIAGSAVASRGSYKARSCNIWPNYVITKHNLNRDLNRINSEQSSDEYDSFNCVYRQFDKNKMLASVSEYIHKIPHSSDYKIDDNMLTSDREMPITCNRNIFSLIPDIESDINYKKNNEIIKRQQYNFTDEDDSDDDNYQIEPVASLLYQRKNLFKSKPFITKKKSSHRKRSSSLPNLLIGQRNPLFLTANSIFDSVGENLQNQIKSVSSPSLSENPLEKHQTKIKQNITIKQKNCAEETNYAGVLHKFKTTLSNFKNSTKSSISQQNNYLNLNDINNMEVTKHRFGPLIWRSSKEKRKVKYNRRDKCNSGDSGIQIELDIDETTNQELIDNIERSSSVGKNHIRRTNSAKISPSIKSYSSAKAKVIKKVGSCDSKLISKSRPTRSLSQPSGLDQCIRTDEDVDIDESDTDSISSNPDLQEEHNPTYAKVLFPFMPLEPQELYLEKGSIVEVIKKNDLWWYGRLINNTGKIKSYGINQGWFPKDFVRIISYLSNDSDNLIERQVPREKSLELQKCDIRMCNTTTILVNSEKDLTKVITSQNQINFENFRSNAIKELLETEINYVKLLSSLCLGYLLEMRRRSDIFHPESVTLIFSNIENIWQFQQSFLNDLKQGIEQNRIAQIFIDHQPGFMIYSTYCNSYPRALMELENCLSNMEAKCILENCRISENLPELPLSAHLLAPIQRLCRYPLHLTELVKHATSRNLLNNQRNESALHSKGSLIDCKESFEFALATMKKVTEMVNEGKRHSENLTRFQTSFENFQGPPIAFHSTRFFMQTDATRVSPNLWNNTYTLFLFDHQLIYCKKDILKRNHFIYKGRIFLDSCRILNLPDGKLFGVTLKNALRIYCESRSKWFDFCFRSSSRKLRFLTTLAAERQFCGSNLFVSELPGDYNENISDREYNSDYDTIIQSTTDGVINSENINNLNFESENNTYNEKLLKYSIKQQKYSDTLPKKSRNTTKDGFDYNTGSLGRRKIGNWFRKAKSTSSTPTQSPTHQTLKTFNSDSSSQSSPALGFKTNKTKLKESTIIAS